VVRRLAEGLSNREIAERLGLSQHTIKNYLFRVFDKLGVSSRLELLFMTLNHAAYFKPAAAEKSNGNGSISREKGSTPSVRMEALLSLIFRSNLRRITLHGYM